jgi:hypothetical protein
MAAATFYVYADAGKKWLEARLVHGRRIASSGESFSSRSSAKEARRERQAARWQRRCGGDD